MKNFKEVRAPKIKKGLRDKKGKLHTVDMKLDGSKLSFRVTDEFGSFKTVNAKGLARMFEGTDVDKFIEEASNPVEEAVGHGIDHRKLQQEIKALSTGPDRKHFVTNQKDFQKIIGFLDVINKYQHQRSSSIAQDTLGRMKKFVVAMDSQPSGIRAQEKVFSIFKKYGLLKKMGLKESVELDEAMNPKDKAKRLKLIKKAVERINKNNAEKAKKDALKMMKDSGMFDESVEITEGKQSYVDQMRDIVAKKSAKKINGVMVDMFTASAVVKVYDAINDTNKAKMDKMTVPAMANVAFKLMKK